MTRGLDCIGVSVVFIVHDGKGNVCLQKRSQTAKDEQGRWDPGGGKLEFGETMDGAVRREVKEELCAIGTEVKFLGAYDAHRKQNGKFTHWVALVHAVKVDPKQVKNGEPNKVDEIAWFTSRNLPSPRHSQFDKAFALAKQHSLIF